MPLWGLWVFHAVSTIKHIKPACSSFGDWGFGFDNFFWVGGSRDVFWLLLVLNCVAVISLTCLVGLRSLLGSSSCKHVMQFDALPLLLYSLYVIVF